MKMYEEMTIRELEDIIKEAVVHGSMLDEYYAATYELKRRINNENRNSNE